jgi:hypothetical protein
MELHCAWHIIFLEQGATKAKAFIKFKSRKSRQIAEGQPPLTSRAKAGVTLLIP